MSWPPTPLRPVLICKGNAARFVNLTPLRERPLMKRKNKSNAPSSGPEEADPFNTMEALQAGEEQPLAYFVRDLTQAMDLLANLLDPPKGEAPQLQFVSRTPRRSVTKNAANTKIEADWESNLRQLQEAIQLSSAPPVGWYLRDVGQVLGLVATALDPPRGARGWRLEFRRQGRGRRPDPQKFQKDSAIARDLLFATWAAGKQEAAIAEVQAKRKISRSKIYRAKKKTQ